MKVIAVADCFIDGHRRRLAAEFEVDADDYTFEGELLLPSCLETDPAIAARKIAELRSLPFRAAKASAGNPANVNKSQDPRDRDLFQPQRPYRTE